MGYSDLKPGFLDRVFNSTISLPQQFIWRIWRAIEDDKIDLFSEEGIADAALIPFLGIADDHRHDVMPDYMAEQMGFADDGDSGMGSQLAAAILSDPLTYMTGGLSSVAKVGKAATMAKRAPALSRNLVKLAEDSGQTLDEVLSGMSPADFIRQIDTTVKELGKESGSKAARQIKHLTKMKGRMGAALPAATRLTKLRGGEEATFTVADAVKQTRDRRISIGLPVLHRWGAKWDVPRDYSSWWQLHKDAVNKGGTLATKALHLQRIVDLPGVGTVLRNTSSPFRHLRGGYRVGKEATVALAKQTALTDPEVEHLGKWLSPDGAAGVALQLEKASSKTGGKEKLVEHVRKVYAANIKKGLSHEDAFKKTLNSVGIGSRKETGAQLYGRMTGRTKDSDFFPKWGPGASEGKRALEGIFDNLAAQHQQASKLNQQGRSSIIPEGTAMKKIADIYETDREKLLPAFKAISENAFSTGQALKGYVNTVFRSGQSSLVGEKAYADFLSNVARDNDQLELLSRGLYTKLNKLVSAKGAKLSQREVTTLVTKFIEMDVLPGEIAASFRVADMNPASTERVMKSLDNWFRRERQSLTTMEKLLRNGDIIKDKATRDALLDVFDEEVFPFFERTQIVDGVEQKSELLAVFDRLIKNKRTTVQVFSPEQQTKMRTRNNKYRITGTVLPLTAAQRAAVNQGKQARPHVLLGKFEGRQAGTLTDGELTDALAELDQAGQRALTPGEILAAAEEMPALQTLRRTLAKQGQAVTTSELLSVLSKRGKAATRLVPRTALEPAPIWKADQTDWALDEAAETARQWGFDLVQEEMVAGGTFTLRPLHLSVGQMSAAMALGVPPGMPIPPMGGFKSQSSAMSALRGFLTRNKDYVEKFGAQRKVKRPLRIAAADLNAFRKLLSAEDLAIIGGKATKFDDTTLPKSAYNSFERLTSLKARRALPEGHPWRHTPIIPTEKRITTMVDTPRTGEEFTAFFRDAGGELVPESGMSEWAVNYVRGRMLIREVYNAMKRSIKYNKPVEIDPRILDEIQQHTTKTGAIIRDIAEAHLPKEFVGMMDIARDISTHSFNAAVRAGVWMPGSPVGYLPRFFNKAARARISRVIGDIEQSHGAILTRLGISQAQYFGRQWDEMPIDDLNELYFGLREAMVEKGASPKLREFHKQLDAEMSAAGIGIAGVQKALPWIKEERLENDAFLALLQRFGVAQQDANLESYFSSMLSASTGKNGESLMLGGKVVGIIDDTGNVQTVPGVSYKGKSVRAERRVGGRRASDTETVALTEELTQQEVIPKKLIIQLEDGTHHTIENGILNETGFGILPLAKAGDEGLGFTPTVGNAFARASMRSDLHNKLIRGPMENHTAQGLMGQHVVFGSQHNIVGMVKTAAQVHNVTPPAVRTMDAINYGIKSFQTIFRLPFHIANLSSGVFQAHMAGATPKNLMASYLDTMRFLFGNQEFSTQISRLSDLMEIQGDVHSLGIVNVLKGDKSRLQEAIRLQGGGSFARWLNKNDPEAFEQLDRFDHLVIELADGSELDMREFFMLAGEMQLYGTFASSLTRGSRTVGDNLVRVKLESLEPTKFARVAGAPKRFMERWANRAETSEVINRTATALALVREGHPMRRAIEIAKEAHVPYEKLTWSERNVMKRLSVYYTFPRHYIPWAWARFAEDPSKLSNIAHFIRDQNVLSTQEGKPNLVVGDYRVDIGRLNANFEAAGMLAAFADRLALPAAEAMVPGMDGYDTRKLRSTYSDMGITNIGGIASLFGGSNLFKDPDREPPGEDMFTEATQIVWPLKMLSQLAGKTPSKSEKSPYVEYTPLESWLTDSVFGVGARKVRDRHELTRASMAYRRMIKRLQLRAASTEDPAKRQRYTRHAHDLAVGLRHIVNETQQKDFQ